VVPGPSQPRPEAPAGIPEIKPATPPRGDGLAGVKADRGQVEGIVGAIKRAGITQRQVNDFGYALQLGVDAVLQLAADGYAVEQIVSVLKGEARPSLGW
jgi:hypothetical protein